MPSWKKVLISGSDAALNSLIVTNGITGSLFGTASSALTASYVNPLHQNLTLTGSFLVSGSTTQIGNNNLLGNTVLSGSITISGNTIMTGSITAINLTASFGYVSASFVDITGKQTVKGYSQYLPTSDIVPIDIVGGYVYSSGSEGDLYFAQTNGSINNVIRLRWLEGNMYSGLLNGGVITTQSSTVYQVSSGSGIIVSLNGSLSTDPYPSVQYISWGNLSSSIAPLSSSFDQSFIAIEPSGSTGIIYVQGLPYDDGQFNTLIPIGNVIHQNRSTINATATYPSVAYGYKQRSSDFIRAFGPLKLSGLNTAVSGSSTGSLQITSGTSYNEGRNYVNDVNNPSYITDSGQPISKIFRYYQSGSSWVYLTNGGAGYTTIDPTQYSLNGVLTPVPGTGANRQWSIQRIYYFPGGATKGIYVYYGNTTYTSAIDAIANIPYENFSEAPNTGAGAVLSSYLVVRNNADFTVPASYNIRPGGLFRNIGGSGGGGSAATTTLSSLTDVDILTNLPTNGQPLVYNAAEFKWKNDSSLTADLIGTASFATTASYVSGSIFTNGNRALSASYALTASFAPNYVLTSATGSMLAPYVLTSSTSSMTVLSSSFAISSSRAVSSSNSLTASYVNTLNQNVLITGSVTIGASSAGASENTLTLGARDTAGEGGQLGFNASGGTHTSASFIDNWQNKARILKGNNTTSTGLIAQWDIHTTQMQLAGYTAASSFPGTATANLAVDSGGNVITVSTTGGSVFPYTGNAVITGSLTVTQPIYVPINGGMYFQGGDDTALYDINVVNTMGIYGVQNSAIGAIKLGSSGPTLYGSASRFGIGTTTPTSASLTVNGNVWATSFTGSLFGTASYATQALSASYALTASFLASTTNAFLQNGNSLGTTALLGTNDSQSLALETNGTTRMFISANGNIGVGTTNFATPSFGGSIPNFIIDNTEGPVVQLRKGSTTTTGQTLGAVEFISQDSSAFKYLAGRIRATSYQGASGGASGGSHITFETGLGDTGTTISEAMRIAATRNILIGTTVDNGTNRLQISGSLNITNGITGSLFGTATTSSVSNTTRISDSPGTTSYFLMSNAPSGVGYETPQRLNTVEYNTDSEILSVASGLGTVAANLIGTASYTNVGSLGGFIQGGNSFGATALLGTNDNQSLALETNGTTKMFISSSGNVGIGNLAPDTKLHIEDVTKVLTNNVAGVAQGTLSLVSTDAQAANVGPSLVFGGNYVDGSQTRIAYAGIAGRKANSSSVNADGYLSFLTWRSTGLTEAMRITPAGFVGIGTTIPGVRFVNAGGLIATGPTLGSGTIGSQALISQNSSYGMYSGVSNNGDVWHQVQRNDGNSATYNLLFNPSGGNVGIGNLAPAEKLDISGNIKMSGGGGRTLTMEATGAGGTEVKLLPNTTGGYARINVGNTAQPLDFQMNNANVMRITQAGNVGIGTTLPNAKLDVNGNTTITGSLAVSQSLLQYSSLASVTTGVTANVALLTTGSFTSAFFDYVTTSGTNARAGTVFTVWNGASVVYTETSTNDIGSTTNLILSASLSAGSIRLQARSVSGTWSVKTLARMI